MGQPLLRIEVAASEVLGGPAVAWVEPNQVIGLVARGEPGSFLRTALLPRFHHLEAGVEETAESDALPAVVSAIAVVMQEVHDLLWRENQIGSASWADALAFALVGEKLYFLAAGDSAAYSVLRGRVYPLTPSQAGAAGLGRGNKARIEITSMDIAGGQRIVLVAAGARPDELAIAQLFGEKLDLQRACDGLLPLSAGTDGGAGVVALSFVPLPRHGETDPEGPFPKGFVEELASAFAEGAEALATSTEAAPFESVEEIEVRPAPPEPRTHTDEPSVRITPSDARHGPPPGTPAPRTVAPARRPPEDIPEPASNVVPFLETLAAAVEPAAASRHVEPEAAAPAPVRAQRHGRAVPPPRPAPLAIGITAGILVILSVLLVLAGPGQRGSGGRWQQMVDVLRGGPKGAAAIPETYVAVRSDPPGASVTIDGKRLAARTPTPPIVVEPGRHRVVVEIGELGRWERTVEVAEGQGLHLNAAVAGNIRISLVDTTRVIEMRLDGRRIGRAPLVVTGVPVGPHRLEAIGTGLAKWERPITVGSADTVRVIVDSAGDEDFAIAAITTTMLAEGGYQPSRGEAVYVDRERIGTAPVEHDLEPGLHSVRVERRNEQPWIEILDARAGGTYFVRAEFGRERGLSIEHYPPEILTTEGPVIVSAVIAGDPEDVTLYYVDTGYERGALAMTRLRDGEPLFVTAIPRSLLESGGLRYYIRARDRMSQDSFSEVYDVEFDEPLRTAER